MLGRPFIEVPADQLQDDSDSILRDIGIWGWILGSKVISKIYVSAKWLCPFGEESIGCYDLDP